MRDPTISCRWCKGTGERKLSPPELRVFKAISKVGPATCPQIFQEINGHYRDSTAVNLYVRRLVNMKLVEKIPMNGERVARYRVAD